MKTQPSISTLLGLNQQEMALLLGVSRGQLSMYEIGKRSLPTSALQKLAKILSYLKERETHAGKDPEPVNQKLLEECRAVYEREKDLKAYRQRKKIEQLEQKRATAQRLQWLDEFFVQGKMEDAPDAHGLIAHKARKGFSEKQERELVGLRMREILPD